MIRTAAAKVAVELRKGAGAAAILAALEEAAGRVRAEVDDQGRAA